MKKRLALFASGSGTNAENIIRYFEHHPDILVTGVYCNNPEAGVFKRVDPYNVPSYHITGADLRSGRVLESLEEAKVDYIILAGFLLLIPENLISAYPDRIINIHPALLPKYGGKGMYGMHVHEAVIANKESESGITIHLVNEEYDKGEHLFQAKIDVEESDTAKDVATKIHKLEYAYFPKVIEKYLRFGKSSS